MKDIDKKIWYYFIETGQIPPITKAEFKIRANYLKEMEKVTEIITDEQLIKAWGNASFGNTPKRDVIANALLKYASGYSTGHTANCICRELGLITKQDNLTTLGKRYLFAAYSNGLSF